MLCPAPAFQLVKYFTKPTGNVIEKHIKYFQLHDAHVYGMRGKCQFNHLHSLLTAHTQYKLVKIDIMLV